MAKVKVELNDRGIQDLLKSSGIQSVLKEYGDQKATQAGEGYSSDVHVFKKRAVAHVFAETPEAIHDNYENNTLLKVVR